jgi:hypothetical protein
MLVEFCPPSLELVIKESILFTHWQSPSHCPESTFCPSFPGIGPWGQCVLFYWLALAIFFLERSCALFSRDQAWRQCHHQAARNGQGWGGKQEQDFSLIHTTLLLLSSRVTLGVPWYVGESFKV